MILSWRERPSHEKEEGGEKKGEGREGLKREGEGGKGKDKGGMGQIQDFEKRGGHHN